MSTDMKNSKLFSPIQIGSLTLKNRIGMAPMSMDYEATDGTVPKRLQDIFVRRAEGGVGYVMIDAVTVDHKYWYIGRTTSLDKDKLIPQFKKFADRVTAAGSTLVPQLIHPGPESICGFKGIKPLGPSVNTNAHGHVSRPISVDEIHKIIKQFGQAARRAEEAGCGGVSLHCAHAYMLPGAFLSPLRNKRFDEYGGSLDNRARFTIEMIEECRRCVSPDFPILLRMSGSDRVPGGTTLQDMLYLAPKFEAAGASMLEVSGGTQYEALDYIIPSNGKPMGINVYEASEIKKVVNIPVYTVGKINDVNYAADIVERGVVDGVSMGRPLLADPDLPKKALENHIDDICPCANCSGSCLTRPDIPQCTCNINPIVGREYDFPFKPAEKVKKVLVIGAGPGGLYSAAEAAERGHDVTIWESTNQIGGQLNLAVKAPGKQEICKWLVWLNHRCKKAGVKIEFKKEATVDLVNEFAPDAVIVATGAKPLVPPITGVSDMKKVYTAHDFLRGNYVIPKGRVCILGGGAVACETAECILTDARPQARNYENIGDVDVTVVEMLPQLLTGVADPNRVPAIKSLRAQGVHEYTSTKIMEVHDHEIKVQDLHTGEAKVLGNFDYVIFGLGARAYDPLSEELKKTIPKVYVIGDAIRARQSSHAMREGFEAAYKL